MPQFIMGFWCGCLFAVLLALVLYFYKKSRQTNRNSEECEEKIKRGKLAENVAFVAPGIRVLLVDDSKLSRKVIKEFLEQTGIVFTEAESGTEALALAKKSKFDLIFLDQMMPGIDGKETMRLLKEGAEKNRDVPVVAVSSGIRKENETEYLEAGFAGCVAKPIQGNRLEELLLRLLPQEKVLQRPEGFSYQNGLKNFDGKDEVYRETLVLFATLWEERKEQLRQFLNEENMTEYAILIHAIKGDARTLGADIFAKLAYEQELKAKAGDVKGIRDGFDKVIQTGDRTAEYFTKLYAE